ncbi:TrbC/VirB2 family protein [Sphingomonas sp. 7/4-4]|uniref:TrbC/VirB2 family protein n=1 Tax=Sphingomonas sp. 7/4-4 TaxID=3018446 RepID=UPI0022F3CC68|nr:TrbC/VirB2 family protein [Sphingomonas sp. 7/4-4]WBY08172.1 TrbC/VirB2 family protein [Sphingomonas sp. 7/4-4]
MAWSYGSSLIEPTGSSVLVASIHWLEGTLLGTIATTVAVISVAGIGFMALTGRVDLRRAATVILGCFILFGAERVSRSTPSTAKDSSTGVRTGLPGIDFFLLKTDA